MRSPARAAIEKSLKTTNSAYIAGHQLPLKTKLQQRGFARPVRGKPAFPISFVVVAGRVPWRLQHLTATARRQIVPAVLIIMDVSMRSTLQHELRSRRNEVRSEPASQSRRAVIVIPFGGPATPQREPAAISTGPIRRAALLANPDVEIVRNTQGPQSRR